MRLVTCNDRFCLSCACVRVLRARVRYLTILAVCVIFHLLEFFDPSNEEWYHGGP